MNCVTNVTKYKVGVVAGIPAGRNSKGGRGVVEKCGRTVNFRLKQKMDIRCLIHNCLTPDIERVPTPRYKKR